jgi:hypothetical protein
MELCQLDRKFAILFLAQLTASRYHSPANAGLLITIVISRPRTTHQVALRVRLQETVSAINRVVLQGARSPLASPRRPA